MSVGSLDLVSVSISSWFLFLFLAHGQSGVSLATNRTSLRNLDSYPACLEDTDCSQGNACFQYMCYPWTTSTGFRWCDKDSDCKKLSVKEEGNGKDGRCFRHQDRKSIQFGICLKKIEVKRCWTHEDCPSYLKCTNGFCGDPTYFKALQDRPCKEDDECERLLSGDMCCFDLEAADQWKHGQDKWRKKCCNNPSGSPVIRPKGKMEPWQIEKLDRGITYLAPYFLDFVVCEALPYETMLKLTSCSPYTTTTTTTDRTSQLHQTSSAFSNMPNIVIVSLLAAFLTSEM